MASNGDIWIQWFSCCFHQPQSPTRRRQRHQRMRIDRSMIGHPTNFVHTGMWRSTGVQLDSENIVDLVRENEKLKSIITSIGRSHRVERRWAHSKSHKCDPKSNAKQRWLRVELTKNSGKFQFQLEMTLFPIAM